MDHWETWALARIAADVSDIKRDVDEIKTWLQRGALLVALWTGALGLNFAPEAVGQMLAKLLK